MTTVHGIGDEAAARVWDEAGLVGEQVASGRWRLLLRQAELAAIAFDGRRVLRGIRFIVRDANWRTAENVVVDAGIGPELLTLRAHARLDGADVPEWELTARFDGACLAVAARCRLLRDFERNRIGLIVLRGPELAGEELEVVHPSGDMERTVFPVAIAPHQPARDVAGYRWRHGGVDAALALAGEVFEMEDQRNWTDASFKTYSTRLADPLPVRLEAGTELVQSLELRCAAIAAVPPCSPAPLRLTPSARRLPELRLLAPAGAAGDAGRAPQSPLGLVVELDTTDAGWPDSLAAAARAADGHPLDVRVFTADPDGVVATGSRASRSRGSLRSIR